MREEILRKFFQGEATASELADDIRGSTKRLSHLVSRVQIENAEGNFVVTRLMLVSLCDAVLSGVLPAGELRTIGFALEASDCFEWDGDEDELVASVIADWSCPEVNYPLTVKNIGRCRAWLTGIEPYPTHTGKLSTSAGHIVSVTEKRELKRRWKWPKKRTRG